MDPLSQADGSWWQKCTKEKMSWTSRRKGRVRVSVPCPEMLQDCQANWPHSLCLRLPKRFPKTISSQPAQREQIRLSRSKSILKCCQTQDLNPLTSFDIKPLELSAGMGESKQGAPPCQVFQSFLQFQLLCDVFLWDLPFLEQCRKHRDMAGTW